MGQLIKTEKELSELREKLKGQTIVATNGCFDILHVGHVRYLKEAKSQGNILVIGVNSDSSVKSLKGSTRPINNEQDRAEILNALSFVDYTYIFSEIETSKFLLTLKPDIYDKGGDYDLEKLPEKEAIKSIGARIHFSTFHNGHSTSSTLMKM
jgi:rfaE bifunctional protein nucleotidyltransferase chain/domain